MSHKVTRRRFLKGLAVAAGSSVLAACAPTVVKETVIVEKVVEKVVKETVIVAGTPEVVEKVVTATPLPASKERTAVRVMNWMLGEEWSSPGWDGLTELYHEEHPDIEIVGVPTQAGGADVVNFLLAVGAGNAPDLMEGVTPRMGQIVEAGAALPIEDMIRQEVLDDLVDSVRQANIWPDGHMYAVPWSCVYRQCYWNNYLCEQAGLDIDNLPLYLPEFDKAVRSIAALGTGEAGEPIYGYARWNTRNYWAGLSYNWFLWMHDTDYVDDDWKVIIDQPPAVEAASLLKAWAVDGIAPTNFPGSDLGPMQVHNRLGANIHFSGYRGVLRSLSGEGEAFDEKMTITKVPYYKNGISQADVFPITWFVSRQSKHPEEALRFAEFVATDPRATAIHWEHQQVPPVSKAFLASVTDDPFLQMQVEQAENDLPFKLGYFAAFIEAMEFAALALSNMEVLHADVQSELTGLAQNLRLLLGLE
ncbi:MAG: substrate-binding domain-containing protein [Chloroflexota bacterium]